MSDNWDDDPNHPEGFDCHGEPLSSGERCSRSAHNAENDALVKVLKKHKVTRDGISTSYFGPTLGWWRCACGWTSEKWEGFHRDRNTDAPAEHVAAQIARVIPSGKGDSDA